MEEIKEKLKPCPFCGNAVKARPIKGAIYSLVGCDKRLCPASEISCYPEQWNTRVSVTPSTEPVCVQCGHSNGVDSKGLLDACASMAAWLRVNPNATAANACAEMVKRIEATIRASHSATAIPNFHTLDADQTFQARVQPWLLACLGAEIASDKVDRNHRFLEESLELVQACGCTQDEANQLVDYVYGRKVGDPSQEVGSTMVTLAALCLANGFDMHNAGETELKRIWTKVETIRAKQAGKPKHSPLPDPPAPATSDTGDEQVADNSLKALETQICNAVETAINLYRCTYHVDGDDPQSGLHLVDVLTPEGQSSIKTGEEEVYLLADFVCGAIVDVFRPLSITQVAVTPQADNPTTEGVDG